MKDSHAPLEITLKIAFKNNLKKVIFIFSVKRTCWPLFPKNNGRLFLGYAIGKLRDVWHDSVHLEIFKAIGYCDAFCAIGVLVRACHYLETLRRCDNLSQGNGKPLVSCDARRVFPPCATCHRLQHLKFLASTVLSPWGLSRQSLQSPSGCRCYQCSGATLIFNSLTSMSCIHNEGQ